MARSTVAVRFTGDTADLQRAIGDVDGRVAGIGSRIGRVARTAGVALAGIGGAAVVMGKGFVDAASDMNETVSKTRAVFKQNASIVETWADSAASSFGQSKQEALEAASSFGNMFLQLGIAEGEATEMSRTMVELASDFASFHNADITEVLTAQTAAFRGEYDAVQRFVPTINAAAVEAKALEMGLAATTGELTAQDKALATQALLMEGAGDAMGDFARTSDGAANQQRILSASWKDAQAELGAALLPALTAVTTWLAENLPAATDKARAAGEALSAFYRDHETVIRSVGIAVGVVLAGAMLAYAVNAGIAAAATLAATWPFVAILAAAAGLAVGIQYLTSKWNDEGSAVWKVHFALAQAVGVVRDIWEWITRLAAKVADLTDRLGDALGPLSRVLELGGRVGGVIGNVGGAIGGVIGKIPGFDSGGIVPGAVGSPQLILAHGGETVLPTHKQRVSSGPLIHVENLSNATLADLEQSVSFMFAVRGL